MSNFSEMMLHEHVVSALSNKDILTPTEIQEKSIPIALAKKDILATAQTGTGKTFAFAIPIVHKILQEKINTALILAPTRELANQIMHSFNSIMGKSLRKKTALLIGGASANRQIRDLKNSPRVIVGTPGRVTDLFNRKIFKLSNIDLLVLDEVDCMLDIGFEKQVSDIVDLLPKKRQTMLYSATMPKNVVKLAAKFLSNPERISLAKNNQTADKIEQDYVFIKQQDKLKNLVAELDKDDRSMIIFVRTKLGAAKLNTLLQKKEYKVDAIHGDLKHHKREKVLASFRKKKIRAIIATDVVARGIDIPHVQLVINYDLPQVSEDYVHRIGRTARAGREGRALSFVTPHDEQGVWRDINCIINPEAAALRKEKKSHAKKSFNRNKNTRKKEYTRDNSRRKSSAARSKKKAS